MSKVTKEVVKVILYYRISTLSKLQIGSMEKQDLFLKKVIEKLERENPNIKYEIVGEECDWGISGTGFLNRDGFTRMLTDYCGLNVTKVEFEKIPHPRIDGGYIQQRKYIVSVDPKKKPKVNAIFVKSCSRFARSVNAVEIIRALRLAGVYLYVADIRQSSKTQEGLQAIIDEITRAENYSTALSVTMSIAKEQMADNNDIIGCPFGYIRHNKVIHKDDTVEPAYLTEHPTKGKGVKIAYELAHAGYGCKRIGLILAQEHGIYADDKTKKPLAPSTVRRLLSNPKYKGLNAVRRWETGSLWEKLSTVKENKDYIEKETDFIPRLVSDELWDAVQTDIQSRQNKENHRGTCSPQHPYKDLLKCYYCGNHFIFSKENAKSGENSHFRCSTKRNKGIKVCDCNNVYEYRLDEYIDNLAKGDMHWLVTRDFENIISHLVTCLEKYMYLLKNPTSLDNEEVKQLREEIEVLNKKKNKLKDLILLSEEDDIMQEDKVEYDALLSEIKKKSNRLEDLSLVPSEVKDRIRNLFKCIQEEIELCEKAKKKYKKDEVLDMLDYIVVAGKTVCNSGGKSPNTVLMPYLKQTTHSLEVLEKCHVEIPLMSGYYIPEAHIEEAGKDITDIIDSDKLFDEKRAELKAEIKYKEKYEDVECPFMTDLQEPNEILAKILVSEDKKKSETDGGYFTKVMGFSPDLGFEKISVVQQIKGYVDNLYKEFLELAA